MCSGMDLVRGEVIEALVDHASRAWKAVELLDGAEIASSSAISCSEVELRLVLELRVVDLAEVVGGEGGSILSPKSWTKRLLLTGLRSMKLLLGMVPCMVAAAAETGCPSSPNMVLLVALGVEWHLWELAT